jgi:hypothetical protein
MMTCLSRKAKFTLLLSALTLTALACGLPFDLSSLGGSPGADPDAGVLFSDDFSSTSTAGWDQYTDAQGTTDYADGSYRIDITDFNWIMWANPGQDFTDVRIEVDATFTSGPVDQNSYGVICRHQDIDNFYALLIASDGAYAIRKRVDGGELDIISGEFYEFADDVIRTGETSNHITAECVGPILRLSANGTLLVEVVDRDITSGDVGLIATTFETDEMEVLFDNFVVYEPTE